MAWFWDNAVTIGTLVMAGAAIVALIYAHWQISENRRAEPRGNANELWRETLRLAFDNPKLSDPTLNLAAFDYEKLHHRRQPGAVPEIRDVRGHDPECKRGDFRGLADQGVARGASSPASPASRPICSRSTT